MVDWITSWDQWWNDVGKYGRMEPWLSDEDEADPEYRKGNMGCGTITFEPLNGWVNFDQYGDAEHLVHTLNLCDLPLDIPDDVFDYLYFSNVLEHIPMNVPDVVGEFWYHLLDELIRITKDGGVWEIHGPDPKDVVETLQVGGHARLVGPHTFNHLAVRYKHGAMYTTEMHDHVRAEFLDITRFYQWKAGVLTDWHLRRYLGRRLGDVAAKIVGRPGQIRMVLRIHKGVLD